MIPVKDNLQTDRVAVVTLLLIAAELIVYLVVQGGGIAHGPGPGEIADHGAIPHDLLHHASALPTLVTATFLHAGVVPLLLCVVFLWWFGSSLEDSMTRWRFLALFLLGGIVSTGVLCVLDAGSTTPVVGAGGAVAALVGAHLALYPGARFLSVRLLPFASGLVEVPSLALVGVWLVAQLLIGATSLGDRLGAGGMTAFVAHLAGLAVGAATIRWLADRPKQVPPRAAVEAVA
ncbi:MAG TPA: rhomboid family intramembrane serine protease [Conexibacter sp.]